MESEQTGLAFSLHPSPDRARANSPVKFLPDFQFPSTKACDFVSFGLDDILHTAASDSEDFGPALADALPPSGQEARPSAAYQADVLKEMDEGTGLTPEAVKELRRATDLALRATKHIARAVRRSIAASVAAERHLWLNLTEIREKENTFLMDAPISQSGLFGEAVSAVVDKFRSAKTQSAALNQFMPRRARDFSTPSSSVSREQPPPRREPPSGGAQATRLPPTTVWGARGWSSSRQQPRKRVNMKRPNKPAASANPGRS